MDNQFNENTEFIRENEPKSNPANEEAPVMDAEYESAAAKDANFEPIKAPAAFYEPVGQQEAPKKKRRNKEKKPLTWTRVAPALIGTTVGGFVIGVIISVFVVFPLMNFKHDFEFSGSFIPFEEFEDFNDFEDFFKYVQPDSEDKNEDKGTQKEAESYTDHPDQLPDIGGNAPIITDYVNPVPDIAEQLSDGIVLITTEITTQFRDGKEQTDAISGGTGFVVSEDGYIVTNNHVIEGGSSFTVTFPDNTEYLAKLVGTDTETDLAVLKIEPKGKLTVLPIGDSDKVRTGEMAIAIGNASGAGETLTGSVTVGYVSAANREISFNGTQQEFIQTDAALNSGNSGGPLVNSKGEVIGVCTLKSLISSYTEYGESVNSEGLGFAIPINKAMEKVQQIILSGSITKPGIGLYYNQLNEEYCAEYNVPMGMLVDSFMPKSPSERAGIRKGDIIVKADGKPIEEIENISEYIGKKGIGGKIEFTVYREGKYLDFTVNIEDVNAMR